jgi:hypothetical protein
MSQMTNTGRVRPITNQPLEIEPPNVNQEIMQRVTGLISLGVSFLNSLICMRYLLKLLEANPANQFARLIYSTTEPFLSAFSGLTRSPLFREVAPEINTLIAIMVYSLLAWASIQLIQIMFLRACASG